jgi:hypothetical protein
MITIKEKVDFRRRSPGRPAGKPAVDTPPGRVPRISKLMALAIRFDRLLRDGAFPASRIWPAWRR